VAVAGGGDTPHYSSAQKPSSTLFLQLQKASLAILVDFGVYFLIFKLYLILLNFCYLFLHVKDNV
jgi:hypothetical protein